MGEESVREVRTIERVRERARFAVGMLVSTTRAIVRTVGNETEIRVSTRKGTSRCSRWTQAGFGVAIDTALHGKQEKAAEVDQTVSIDSLLLEHVFAVRMQAAFRARQARARVLKTKGYSAHTHSPAPVPHKKKLWHRR